ncbi:MAG: hypothetical protein DA407_08885 [Bacteroidetes bacterium]|nr:MAG: hypothetical protein DA407_08885 [Bacteroidota bacterium]
METVLTWLDFLKLAILLILGLIILRTILKFAPQFIKRKSVFNKVSLYLNTVIELYKPIAILILLIAFVSINYKVHGILFIVCFIISFSYIKNYFNGVLFKLNPIVSIGSNITVGDFKGEIEKFLAFGVVVNENDGTRFIKYSNIEINGFIINQTEYDAMRKTVYLQDLQNSTELIDLLFDNPMVNFKNKPSLKKIDNQNMHQLQLTLEKGAKLDAILDYLQKHNITTSLTK